MFRSAFDGTPWPTAGFVAGLVGCGGCGSSHTLPASADAGNDQDSGVPGIQAGLDAGATRGPNAEPDAWASAHVDAGATTSDGCSPGPQAVGGPFIGAWAPIPEAPACCTAVVAQAPSRSISAWTWSPCPSGRAGCRVLNVDWTTNPGRSIDFRTTEAVRIVGGQPYMTYSRVFPTGPLSLNGMSAFIDVVQPIDGAPIFAVGVAADPTTFVAGCSFWSTFGEAGIGFVGNSGPTYFVSWSSWNSPSQMSSKIVSNADLGIGPSGYPQGTVLGTQFYFETKGPDSVDIFDIVSQKIIIPSTPQRLPGESPRAVPDGALVMDYTMPFRVDLLRMDGAYAELIAPTSPQVVTALALDRSNGNALVWVESDNQATYLNSSIWTAPYTTNAGSLSRRKVAVISNDTLHYGGGGMVVNRGVTLNLIDPSVALITRLSDGMSWRVAAEPGRPFVWPVWVDDNEVWLTTADGSLKGYSTYPSDVVRIARSTLGPPTVPPGL